MFSALAKGSVSIPVLRSLWLLPLRVMTFGVVDDAVDHRRSDDLVTENVAPAGEGQVAGQDQRGVFVAGRDELEEQVRGGLLEGDLADFFDDQEPVASQPGELLGEPSGVMGGLESGDPLGRGREQDPMA